MRSSMNCTLIPIVREINTKPVSFPQKTAHPAPVFSRCCIWRRRLPSSFPCSISAIGKNKYTEEHLQICESLRIPLANALTVLLQRRSESPLSAFPPLAAGQTFNGAGAPSMMLEEVTTSYIHHVLAYTRGRVSGPRGAARILGIPASTLVSKLRKLGVNPKAYFKAGD